MYNFVIDWLIVGVVVYVIGRLAGSDKGRWPVGLFFVMLVAWPITVLSFIVTTVKVIKVLARKHGLR